MASDQHALRRCSVLHLAARYYGSEVQRFATEHGRPSVVGRLRGGDGPSVMLNAHYDTVGVEGMQDPFSGAVVDGRLYGRGAYDMKGALAACLGAARSLADAGLNVPGDLLISAGADEEVASLGTRDILRHLRPDRAIVTEPTQLQICLAHKGFVWAEYECTGRAAHGSRPDLGIDANRGLLPVLTALDDYIRTLASRDAHPLVGPPSAQVGTLRGGTALSVYAARSRAGVERRTIPGEEAAEVIAELQSLIAEGNGTCSFAHVLTRAPFEGSADRPIVRALERACTAEMETVPPHVGEGPWMDAALFADAGVETVVIGPAGAGPHSEVEWVDTASLMTLSRVLARLVSGT